MKYLAVLVMSVTSILNASASSSGARAVPALDPVGTEVHAAQAIAAGDSWMMLALAGALISLQLRRRQKSLRNPRVSI